MHLHYFFQNNKNKKIIYYLDDILNNSFEFVNIYHYRNMYKIYKFKNNI